MTSAPAEQPDTSLLIAESPCSCGGLVAVFVGDYVTWGRCTICGQPRVIGWVSCQGSTFGTPAETSPGSRVSAGGSQS